MSYPSHVPRFFYPNITCWKLFENYKTPKTAVYSGILRPFVPSFKNSSHHIDRTHLQSTSLRDVDIPNFITIHSNMSNNSPHLHPYMRSFLERFWRQNKRASVDAEMLRDAIGDAPLQYRQPVLMTVSYSKSQSQLCRDDIVTNYTWIHFVCLYYQDSKFREKLGRSRRGSFVQFSSDDGQFDLEAHKLQPRVQNSSFLNAIDENIRSYPKSLFSLSVNGLVQCFSAEYKIRAKRKKRKRNITKSAWDIHVP
jgi:hypothetical protein